MAGMRPGQSRKHAWRLASFADFDASYAAEGRICSGEKVSRSNKSLLKAGLIASPFGFPTASRLVGPRNLLSLHGITRVAHRKNNAAPYKSPKEASVETTPWKTRRDGGNKGTGTTHDEAILAPENPPADHCL
ncbi:hypothetical protein Bbelb_245980 [Branchiostoma belcheri]|nr:hypothetical protein Bbelb_245980 [Branchiostoma belcheri]